MLESLTIRGFRGSDYSADVSNSPISIEWPPNSFAPNCTRTSCAAAHSPAWSWSDFLKLPDLEKHHQGLQGAPTPCTHRWEPATWSIPLQVGWFSHRFPFCRLWVCCKINGRAEHGNLRLPWRLFCPSEGTTRNRCEEQAVRQQWGKNEQG